MRWLLGAACSALLLAAPAASRTSRACSTASTLSATSPSRADRVGRRLAHGAYAYVGSSCGSERRGGGGVRIVDISRPSHPRLVARLGNDAFTRAEDLVVGTSGRRRSTATWRSSASRRAWAAGRRHCQDRAALLRRHPPAAPRVDRNLAPAARRDRLPRGRPRPAARRAPTRRLRAAAPGSGRGRRTPSSPAGCRSSTPRIPPIR